jgi:hypothetical protein
MGHNRLSDLQEVFVRFEAVEAKGTSIVFFNEKLKCGLSKEEVLSKYSYVIANSSSVGKVGTDKKTFFAERYGGDGILRNGGGGRCGFDGDFQVKGIGPNQLVGEDVEAADGNGLMSLDSAIYESIWAEIIHIALPYGAIRAVAVIDTGYDFEHGGKSYPRGLLVRMPAVRPAHFIRAVYFKERQCNAMSEDAKRVRAAIQKLVDFLPVSPNDPHANDVYNRLSSGLVELARRYAKQFAAARAKRIIHYNVSASNISLDGAWVDFSSARIFSQFILGDRVDVEKFTKEYVPVIESIQSICYYLSKYLVIGFNDSNRILEQAVNEFALEYDRQFNLYCAMQIGFPPCLLDDMAENPVFLEFSQILQKILAFDDFSMTPVTTELGWEGYEHWGLRLYAELLKGKALNTELDLSWLRIEFTLLDQLSLAYSHVFELVCDKAHVKGVSRAGVICGIAINLIRLNRSNVLLLNLEDRVAEMAEGASATGKYSGCRTLIERATNAAYLEFYNEVAFTIPFWISNSLKIWYDVKFNFFIMKVPGGSLFSVKSLSEFGVKDAEVNKALSFYNGIWSTIFEKEL